MGNDDPATSAGAIQVPPHVTGLVREMFTRIVAELSRHNKSAGTDDTVLIEKLAEQLARIQDVDTLMGFGYAIASAAEAIEIKCWNLACEFAADLQLRPDDLRPLVWT